MVAISVSKFAAINGVDVCFVGWPAAVPLTFVYPISRVVCLVGRCHGNRGAIDAERQLRKVTVTSVVTPGAAGVPNFIARPR